MSDCILYEENIYMNILENAFLFILSSFFYHRRLIQNIFIAGIQTMDEMHGIPCRQPNMGVDAWDSPKMAPHKELSARPKGQVRRIFCSS
jgi:hypothetical protein